MLPVIYSMSVSLDGFIAAPDGDIGWFPPDPELFGFHVEQTRHIAAYGGGRGIYLIDEYRQFVYPVVLGGGTPYFPPLAERLDLRLIESPDHRLTRDLPSLSVHALSRQPRKAAYSIAWYSNSSLRQLVTL